MAQLVHQYLSTIPAGTPKASPHTDQIGLNNLVIESIELEVPAGPNGLMGFYVANGGTQWMPSTAGTWLIWDDKIETWRLENQPHGGGWSIVGYNTGKYPHTITTRWHVNPLDTPGPAGPDYIPSVTFIVSGVNPGDTVVL